MYSKKAAEAMPLVVIIISVVFFVIILAIVLKMLRLT